MPLTKQQKIEQVQALTAEFEANPQFMVLDIMGMSAQENNNLRNTLHQQGMKLEMVKNTLIRKALENLEGDYTELWPALKESSTLVFFPESPKGLAKALKDFRGDGELPKLKAAYVDDTAFIGDEQLEALTKLKSKQDLIGEVITLLQSPAKNVISALQSSGSKLSGILKTLQERNENA